MTGPIRFEEVAAPRASLIVLGWRSAPCLLDCLRSIRRQVAGVAYEVVVALNEPTDELVRRIDEDVTGAVVVTSGVNRGFAGGCNMGAERATVSTSCCSMTTPSSRPGGSKPWPRRPTPTRGRVPSAARSSIQMAPCKKPAPSCGETNAAAVGGTVLPSDRSVLEKLRHVDFCGGEALLVRRATWDAVGGLSEDYYPAYYEDADLCLRIGIWARRCSLDRPPGCNMHGATRPTAGCSSS